MTVEHPPYFSLEYMRWLVNLAKNQGYTFYTVKDYLSAECPKEHAFIMKHDLDSRPETLEPIINLQRFSKIRSTIYVRVTANDYNVMSYRTLPMLIRAEKDGFEIGLHTNFYEYALINDLDPLTVLKSETTLLKSFLNIRGMSTHRDLNYVHNALPWVEERWDEIKNVLDLDYQAYDKRLMENTIYVNEGYSPHLCWRNSSPEDAILTGKSVYMLTHNNWWYATHPFE